MKQITFEIQRLNANGWGMCRARLFSLDEAIREIELTQVDDPKSRYRIVERTERVVFLSEVATKSP